MLQVNRKILCRFNPYPICPTVFHTVTKKIHLNAHNDILLSLLSTNSHSVTWHQIRQSVDIFFKLHSHSCRWIPTNIFFLLQKSNRGMELLIEECQCTSLKWIIIYYEIVVLLFSSSVHSLLVRWSQSINLSSYCTVRTFVPSKLSSWCCRSSLQQ